jgi:opacity protein-like surface antigen
MTLIRNFTHLVRSVSMLSLLAALLLTATAASAASQEGSAASAASQARANADTHYGPFGLLDHRSRYGQFWFPEPFRLDETDVDNEVRLDWVHQKGKDHVTDEGHVELEKAFGVTTFELEIPYERTSETTVDSVTGLKSHEHTWGAGNVELSVRRPIYQWVSRDDFFDNTVGAAFELGLPTNSPVSKNTEVVAKMFDSLRVGEHFSLQALGGYSILMGPGDEGGNHTFEYGLVAGYNLSRQDLALPYVEQLIPILELKGETGLNRDIAGTNILTGTVGVRANLEAIGAWQPRIGIGYIFPIDKGGREESKWGVVTSLVFEY